MSQAYQPDSTKTSAKIATAATLNLPKSKTLMRLLAYLKPYWWAILLTIIGFAINAATEIWIAKLLQYITDAINQNDQSKQDLFPFIIVMLFFVRGVGSFLVITIRHWCHEIWSMSYG